MSVSQFAPRSAPRLRAEQTQKEKGRSHRRSVPLRYGAGGALIFSHPYSLTHPFTHSLTHLTYSRQSVIEADMALTATEEGLVVWGGAIGVLVLIAIASYFTFKHFEPNKEGKFNSLMHCHGHPL